MLRFQIGRDGCVVQAVRRGEICGLKWSSVNLEALELSGKGIINPAVLVTHIGGLDCVIDTTLNLPNIPGGKKLVYNNISMPLTAIDDFAEKGKADPLFKRLAEIVAANNGLWCGEAEKYLLENGKRI